MYLISIIFRIDVLNKLFGCSHTFESVCFENKNVWACLTAKNGAYLKSPIAKDIKWTKIYFCSKMMFEICNQCRKTK